MDDDDLDAADEPAKAMDFPDWEVRAGDPGVFRPRPLADFREASAS